VEGTGFTNAPTEVFLFRGRQPPVAFTVANDTDWCNITTSELVLSYYKPEVSTLQRVADAQGAWRPACSHDQCDVKRLVLEAHGPDDRRATASLPPPFPPLPPPVQLLLLAHPPITRTPNAHNSRAFRRHVGANERRVLRQPLPSIRRRLRISSQRRCRRHQFDRGVHAQRQAPIAHLRGFTKRVLRCVRERPRVWRICVPLDRWSRLLSSRAQHDRWTKATHKRHARLQDDHSRSPKPRSVPTTTTWATRGDGCVRQAPSASAELE